MDRSRNTRGLLPEHSALQHEQERGGHAPRPLPLFLELVRQVSERDPALARAAALLGVSLEPDKAAALFRSK